jgi:hypothetical protein
MWHDLSTIANHGHLVFMVSYLYDHAVHYTNEVYRDITGSENVDIQMKVQTPEVYIVVRSGSSDFEQLAFIDTRLQCLQDMSFKLKTNSGNDFTDAMRLLHGDSPARHLESGQQKGGNFYCSGCGANAQQAYITWIFVFPAITCLCLTDNNWCSLDCLGRKRSLTKAHSRT